MPVTPCSSGPVRRRCVSSRCSSTAAPSPSVELRRMTRPEGHPSSSVPQRAVGPATWLLPSHRRHPVTARSTRGPDGGGKSFLSSGSTRHSGASSKMATRWTSSTTCPHSLGRLFRWTSARLSEQCSKVRAEGPMSLKRSGRKLMRRRTQSTPGEKDCQRLKRWFPSTANPTEGQ